MSAVRAAIEVMAADLVAAAERHDRHHPRTTPTDDQQARDWMGDHLIVTAVTGKEM